MTDPKILIKYTEEYKESNQRRCPHCGARDSFDQFSNMKFHDLYEATEEVSCTNCGYTFKLAYVSKFDTIIDAWDENGDNIQNDK